MRLSKQQRGDVIAEVRERLAQMPHVPRHQACVFSACFTAIAIAKRGVRAVLQAGTAQFRYKAPELDDGGDTHLSYIFDLKDIATAMRIADGILPEIHCWTGIPKTGELVDLTTGTLVEALAETRPGERWTMPHPPPEIWGVGTMLPDQFRYSASLEATMLVIEFLRRGRRDLWEELSRRGIVPN